MSYSVRCIDCNKITPYHPTSINCPNCNSQWRDVEYDYDIIAKELETRITHRPFDLWRYFELLPVQAINRSIQLGEGGTPLLQANNLGMMLGCPNIFIKDERQGPTGSFKDRQAAVTIAALKEAGITEMVVASTGNVAISYSAYAARAGIKLWAFVTSLVPPVKMREIALYGSQVVKVTGSYDQAKQIAAEFARQRNLYLDMGARTLTSIEAMKMLGYEIAEQLAQFPQLEKNDAVSTNSHWRAPDWYIQSVSGGMGPLGVAKSFREMKRMGFIDNTPSLAVIQTEGCAPMVHAWNDGLEKAVPVTSPRTHIETLATGDPGRAYTLLYKQVRDSHGVFDNVSDEEAFRAMHVLAKMEGISAEPAAGVAFAGLFKLVRSGVIKSSDVIVINCTGHTVPAEPFILGDNWARNVVLPSQTKKEIPEEGLLSALSNIAPDRFPCIAIVDDNPDVRRLIRRILQSQGNFIIHEAEGGRVGLEIIDKEKPDLVILDLMMPDVDGFSVLDAMKSKPETASIPVIVATAKELTPEEKGRLKGQIQALMQKGDFLSDEFLDEVRTLLG